LSLERILLAFRCDIDINAARFSAVMNKDPLARSAACTRLIVATLRPLVEDIETRAGSVVEVVNSRGCKGPDVWGAPNGPTTRLSSNTAKAQLSEVSMA